jgi:hypothetical protein
MSAIALKSDIAERDYDVRFVQKRTHAPLQNELLFDHVVSAGENRRWNRYPNRLSDPEVDKTCTLLRSGIRLRLPLPAPAEQT